MLGVSFTPQVSGFSALGAADGTLVAPRALPGKGACLGIRNGCTPGGDEPVPRGVPVGSFARCTLSPSSPAREEIKLGVR